MKTTAAVIDFGTSKIVTVLAESGAFSQFDVRGSGTVPYAGYQKGQWLEPIELAAQVKQSIAAAELEAKMSIKEIYVSVPADFIRIKLADAEAPVAAEDGRITEEDMDAVHDAAADSLSLEMHSGLIVHRSPAWFSVDGGKKTMSPIRAIKKGRMLRALTSFVIADEGFVRQMHELFDPLQIRISGFISPAFAQAQFCMTTAERDRTAILVDVGYLNTEISMVEGDAIVYHRVLPVGGGFITADLLENLSINMESAERLKREFSLEMDELAEQRTYSVIMGDSRYDFSTAHVAGAMAQTMDELLAGIDDALHEAGAAVAQDAKLFLTGGGIAQMQGAADWLSDQLDRTVKIAQTSSAKLAGPRFTSALSMVNLVFDTIEPPEDKDDTLPGKIVSGMRNLLRKEDRSEQE